MPEKKNFTFVQVNCQKGNVLAVLAGANNLSFSSQQMQLGSHPLHIYIYDKLPNFTHFQDVFLNDKLHNFFPKEIYMVHWECCQVQNYPNRNYAKLDSNSPPQFGRSSAANTALSKNLSKHIRRRKSKHNRKEKIYLSTTNKRKSI